MRPAPEPTPGASVLARALARPLVRRLAWLTLADWALVATAVAAGQVAAGVAASLVGGSAVFWVFVLFWYPFLIPTLLLLSGPRSARFGLFLEQVVLGMLAGLHLLWAVYVGWRLLA